MPWRRSSQPMSVSIELTHTQLELVMHVANGLRYDEIATLTHRSESSVKKTLTTARKNSGAHTMAHLVSMVIATGVLEWVPDDSERRLNGDNSDDNRDVC